MSSRVYLDSCAVIYLLEGEPELSLAMGALMKEEGAEAEFCVSDLTRLECRVAPLREDDTELLDLYDQYFASEGIVYLPIRSPTFELATELRAHHGTKTPDAIHLAAAVLGKCDSFWTNDHRLAPAAEGRIELRVVP